VNISRNVRWWGIVFWLVAIFMLNREFAELERKIASNKKVQVDLLERFKRG